MAEEASSDAAPSVKGDDGARVAAEAAAGAVAAARSAETQAREVAKEAHAAAALAERAASIAADHEHRERERRLLDELGVDVDAPEVEAEINRLQAGVS